MTATTHQPKSQRPENAPRDPRDNLILLIVAGYAFAFVAFGFAVDGPMRSSAVWSRSSPPATPC
jgi:hypothetical protein